MASVLMGPKQAEVQLKGNTLRVYVYVLKKRKVGVREVQHALHFSNPSLDDFIGTKVYHFSISTVIVLCTESIVLFVE